jgi:membrane-anchored glycerophosphoryl diester phosphodiesterase (GDPDase)
MNRVEANLEACNVKVRLTKRELFWVRFNVYIECISCAASGILFCWISQLLYENAAFLSFVIGSIGLVIIANILFIISNSEKCIRIEILTNRLREFQDERVKLECEVVKLKNSNV